MWKKQEMKPTGSVFLTWGGAEMLGRRDGPRSMAVTLVYPSVLNDSSCLYT